MKARPKKVSNKAGKENLLLFPSPNCELCVVVVVVESEEEVEESSPVVPCEVLPVFSLPVFLRGYDH